MAGPVWGCWGSALGRELKEGKERKSEGGRAQDSINPASLSAEFMKTPLGETASLETVNLPQTKPGRPWAADP